MFRTLLVAVLVAGASADLAAQTVVAVPAGSRVRVSLVNGGDGPVVQRQVGTLVALDNGSVVVRNGSGDPRSYAMSSVETLEVSMGRRSRTGRGALIGGLVLGTVSAVNAYIEESRCEPHFGGWFMECVDPAAMGVVGFVVGGAVGAGAGALVGSFIRTDRWKPLPHGARTTLVPARGRLAFSISVPN
jgi:hypothetical protein